MSDYKISNQVFKETIEYIGIKSTVNKTKILEPNSIEFASKCHLFFEHVHKFSFAELQEYFQSKK